MGWLSSPLGRLGVGVGGSLLGNWLGNRAQQSAMQRSPEELAALRGGTGAATGLGAQGSTLTTQGLSNVGGASNYWQTLLHGNRAAMAQATAAPRGAITDQYRGAERGLERSGVRGGVADLARAELSRDRAGKIAGLTSGVQPMAAEQLGGLGTTLTGQGTAAMIGAGNTWAGLLKAATENRQNAQQVGQQTSAGFGSLLFDLMGTGGATAGAGAGSSSAAGGSSGGHWYDWFTKLFKNFGGGGSHSEDNQSWDPWYGYDLGGGTTGGGGKGGNNKGGAGGPR